MTVYRKTAATATLCLVLGLIAAALQEGSRGLDGSAAARADCAGQTPGTAHATGRARRCTDPARADGRRNIRAKVSRTAEQGTSAGRRLLRARSVDDSRRARASLTTNANWLKQWSNTRITIEGHCDERGTAEYNLSLGERRANAVKAYLVELGVPGDRIVTVSKGKESPFCTESNEACWQQNRRGHFLITAK